MITKKYTTGPFERCLRVPGGRYHAPEYIGCDCMRGQAKTDAENHHLKERLAVIACCIIAGICIGVIVMCWPNLVALFN